MENEKQHQKGLDATLKSKDTEEWLDIHFTRPLGYAWALFFNKFNIHPNVVTILSIILGVAAGYCFYYPDTLHTVIGILLLIWANIYDSTDGQLARMKGKKTRWGRMLDGFAGDLWFSAIYLAICLRLYDEWGMTIFIIAALSGFVFHSSQCQLADYYRNIHLYFLKGAEGSELDTFRQQREILHSLPWKHNFWWKMFLYFYGNYTHAQERMTPNFQDLKVVLKTRYNGSIPQDFRDKFLNGSRPLMKYTNILTFNTRAIALYISLLIGEPQYYFYFEIIVLTVIYFYMRHRHEAMCGRMCNELIHTM